MDDCVICNWLPPLHVLRQHCNSSLIRAHGCDDIFREPGLHGRWWDRLNPLPWENNSAQIDGNEMHPASTPSYIESKKLCNCYDQAARRKTILLCWNSCSLFRVFNRTGYRRSMRWTVHLSGRGFEIWRSPATPHYEKSRNWKNQRNKNKRSPLFVSCHGSFQKIADVCHYLGSNYIA